MERILTVEQMQNADKYTIERLGISTETLVERAGIAIANEITKRFFGGRVLVCCGKGNNGEDGKIIAKILTQKHGFSVYTVNVSNGIFKVFSSKFDIIVDCIFGTGLNREVTGKYLEAINLINNSGAFIVSCDIPSGLNGNTGMPMGASVRADLTIAIQEYKLGHFLGEGKDYCGEVVAKDIGISFWEEQPANRFNNVDMEKFFPLRKQNSNKGNFGKACIFGGSLNFPGSVILSYNSLTALKMGVGYSNLTIPKCLFNSLALINPECTVNISKDDGESIVFDKNLLDKLLKYNTIAFGMGVGVSEDIYKVIKYLLENFTGRLIIDADAINTLSKFGTDVLLNKKCEVCLTPHIGEFSRLISVDKEQILNNIINISKEFAKKYNVVLCLKNAVSVITDGNEVYINTTGNVGMAKAGSGDTLDGIIAGLSCRDFSLLECVTASCYLFGKAGDIVSNKQNEYTNTATDIINALSSAINSIR